MSSRESCDSKNTISSIQPVEEEHFVAAKQRLRTLEFYERCGISSSELQVAVKPSVNTGTTPTTRTVQNVKVHLWDGKSYKAAYFHGADSQETKFVVSGLETDWGTHKRGLVVRASDLVRLEVTLSNNKQK
ncbi:hypothetical protein NADFUDRAFT_84183 [Nadsonia fulvescens var. elongata DSM 6958]|uniref:Uncharacterized protein n=1 Tax=Nadsonia fulvescens var. elongata DSM 6958 TaxID=857566 RepID=A0A1E3PDN8_9ASCO|nr:hypothetical protein NADFUDRAFT_84183 [Nadsonia fulvescens var. elongata DSM 6958]